MQRARSPSNSVAATAKFPIACRSRGAGTTRCVSFARGPKSSMAHGDSPRRGLRTSCAPPAPPISPSAPAAATGSRTSQILLHFADEDDQAHAGSVLPRSDDLVAMLLVEGLADQTGADAHRAPTAGEDGGFGMHEKGAADAAARPARMDVESLDLVPREGAEARQTAPGVPRRLGEEEALATLRHGADIAAGREAAGPALDLGPAVAAGAEAADRFLVQALDEGGVAGRPRPEDEAGR